MKTIELPNGKQVMIDRIERSWISKLRCHGVHGKELNRKKNFNRQNDRREIQQQLDELEEELHELNAVMENYE